MSVLKLLRSFVLLLLMYCTLIACNVQKKRYSSGFYFNKHHSVTTKSINHVFQIDSLSSSPRLTSKNVIEVQSEKASLKLQVPSNESVNLISSKELKKLNHSVEGDTIPKNKVPDNGSNIKQPKEKMEFYTMLALYTLILNVILGITIFLLLGLVPIPFFIIYAGICCEILSIIAMIFCSVRDLRVRKTYDNFKFPNLADELNFISIIALCANLMLLWLILKVTAD